MLTIKNKNLALDSKAYAVLVIEDNPGDYALVEEFLYERIAAPIITHAKNFKDAAILLSVDLDRFDVVLLDLSLPDKMGEPLIREVVELCANTAVIVLTGNASFAFGVMSLSLGVSDYLLKDDLTSMFLYKSIVYAVERKKSIAALEESERRYSKIFDFSPLPMWVIDMDTLAFLDVNKATIKHFGYTREELLAMTLRDVRPEDEVADVEKEIEESKRYPEKVEHLQTTHRRKNGELREVEIQFAQFKYKGCRSNVVIATDVTERLNYIKAIEEQNEKLQEISWIQSHVVRAPLSRIMGLIPLITESPTYNEDKKLMLHYLSQSADELDVVIKDITKRTSIPETGQSFVANTSLQIHT